MRASLLLVLVSTGCAHARSDGPRSLPTPVIAPADAGVRPQAVVLEPAQLAYVADADGGFPSMLTTPGPRLVLAVLDQLPSFVDPKVDPDDPGVADVDDEVLARLGIVRPPVVWLVARGGACRATVGGGYVGAYLEGMPVYEVGFHLEPCASVFAPLAVLAEQVPARLRWIAATIELDEKVGARTQTHPLASAFEALRLGAAYPEVAELAEAAEPAEPTKSPEPAETEPAPVQRVRLSTVAGTPLRQLITVDYWPSPVECEDAEVVTIGNGLWDGTKLHWLPPPPAESWAGQVGAPELVGALVDGDVPVAVVHTLRFQAVVTTRDAAGEYRWSELATGSYHDEDVAFSAYSVRQYCGP